MNYDEVMLTGKDLIRFILEFSANKREQFEDSTNNILQNADDIVNYLRHEDPKQYVVNGLLLCEDKVKELIAKHIPGNDFSRKKFIDLLEVLHKNDFLDSSEIPPYKKLNNLRNKVAHQLSYQVRARDADDIWNTLDKNQRTQIEQRYEINHSVAKENPQVLVKAMILRLYTHIAYIVEREDAKDDVKNFFIKLQGQKF